MPSPFAVAVTAGRTAALAACAGAALALAALPASAQAAEPRPDAPRLGLLDAVRLMVDHDRTLTVGQARVRANEGLELQAIGRFDPRLSTSLVGADQVEPLTTLTDERTQTVESTLGLISELPSGLSVEPSISLRRTEGQLGLPANSGTVALSFRQPLYRGRGRAVNLAVERSARRRTAASRSDLAHLTALRVLVVATRYWELRAAQLDLEILRVSEDGARRLLETTRRLVEADVTPAAELVQLQANLAAKEAARIGGERALVVGEQALGREIGLTPAAIRELPPPGDAFPEVSPLSQPTLLDVAGADRLIALALERRDDLRAAADVSESDRLLGVAAADAMRPELDLIFTPSYTGLVADDDPSGFFAPLYDNVPGASFSFGFSWSSPLRDQQARGALLASQAAHAASRALLEQVRQTIGADVAAALATVAAGALEAERSAEAVVLFEQTVLNEEKKLQAGSSTLLDVISQRDRLTAARRSEVAARLELALAVLELRFQTGTLIPAAGTDALTAAHLTTLPDRELAP